MAPSDIHQSPVLNLAQELEAHHRGLNRLQGRDFIGLAQKTIPSLDKSLLGLRGLMLLAAAPNVGKTALAVQLGLDVVANNPDACFLFVSLEMNRTDIITRMLCNRARMDWSSMVLGLQGGGDGFSPDQEKALAGARAQMAKLGERIVILDENNFPDPDVDQILAQLNQLKQQTGCSRALILVDYLQAYPLPMVGPQASLVRGDLELDAWRVGAMKTLRDKSNDAVLVISEVKRPEPGRAWASSLKDIVGSSRTIYTPDIILLLQNLNREEAVKEIGGDPGAARAQLDKMGMTFNRLQIAKGRDGVTRETLKLTFFYRQSRFASGYKVFV